MEAEKPTMKDKNTACFMLKRLLNTNSHSSSAKIKDMEASNLRGHSKTTLQEGEGR